MTLDEMIATCEEGSKAAWNGRPTQGALEYRQLAEWLKELKSHREAWDGMKEGLLEMSRLHEYVSIKHMIQLIDKARPKDGDSNADID